MEAGKPGTEGYERGDHSISCNYIVGWNDTGDWRNYTRDFGASKRYNVFTRMSSGGADEHSTLSMVTSDPAAPGQATSLLGAFDATATGSWDIFHTIPMRDNAGNLASVRLSGVTTLRYTTGAGNQDHNYIALVDKNKCDPNSRSDSGNSSSSNAGSNAPAGSRLEHRTEVRVVCASWTT